MLHDARAFGIRVVREAGVEQYCLCPFHSDHSPSASFNRTKGVLYCYVCGKAWGVEELEKEFEIESLGEREPMDFDLMAPDTSFDLGEKWEDAPYFRKRGITKQAIRHYQVRWKAGEPEGAVMPITDYEYRVQGVAYRFLSGYTRYKVYGKTTPVWPMHLFNGIRNFQGVIVTEGAWSAMRIASICGYQYLPVALLGAKASQRIADTLRPFPTVFLYDNDDAGRRACHKMRELFPIAKSWVVSISPDDMTVGQVLQLYDKLQDERAFS